jgi:hypothetical protein
MSDGDDGDGSATDTGFIELEIVESPEMYARLKTQAMSTRIIRRRSRRWTLKCNLLVRFSVDLMEYKKKNFKIDLKQSSS